jgi:ZIP family zinc transporter
MWANLQAPLFFGLIAAFITSIGLVAVAQRGLWSERNASLFALAAGGMLLTLTLLHITPEAIERTRMAPALILSGFLGGLLLNKTVSALFGDEATGPNRAAAATPVIAIAIHSFLDGIIYAVTFSHSFESGAFVALSLILHEFPEGVIAFTILRRSGFSGRQSFVFAFLAAAATTPLGVIASGPFIYLMSEEMVGNLFAISAGLLLFVATGPLMAPLRHERPKRSLTALGIGVVIAAIISLSPFSRHDDHHHSGHDTHAILAQTGDLAPSLHTISQSYLINQFRRSQTLG